MDAQISVRILFTFFYLKFHINFYSSGRYDGYGDDVFSLWSIDLNDCAEKLTLRAANPRRPGATLSLPRQKRNLKTGTKTTTIQMSLWCRMLRSELLMNSMEMTPITKTKYQQRNQKKIKYISCFFKLNIHYMYFFIKCRLFSDKFFYK